MLKKSFLLCVTFLLLGTIMVTAQLPGNNDKSAVLDSDGDGIKDACDADSDNDGIPDDWENFNRNSRYNDDDIDGDLVFIGVAGDGVSSYLDLDSDNDGILDLFESGVPNAVIDMIDVDHNGIIDANIAVGNNGFADVLETFPDSGIPKYALRNTDGDDKPDFVDLASDAATYDLYAIGKGYLDELGGGFIMSPQQWQWYSNPGPNPYSQITDRDMDGIMTIVSTNEVDTDSMQRGAPDSPLSPYGATSTPNTNLTNISFNCPSLPVLFGTVKASFRNNVLQVSWQTLTEINNDHFEIEASVSTADGKTFTKIAEIKSKANDGNSTTGIEYSIDITNTSNILSAMGLLGLLGLAIPAKSKRFKLLFLCIGAIIMTTLSCSKNSSPVTENNSEIFIRVKQVDKDGHADYSKVIKVVK